MDCFIYRKPNKTEAVKMKQIIKLSIILSLLLISCQEEEYEVLTGEDQPGLAEGTEFYNLVERAAMHDGSEDDELDESPCFSIGFPFNLSVEGVELRVRTAADLQAVLQTLNESGRRNISLRFPVSIINSEYERENIEDAEEFEELQQECQEELASNEGPITCAQIQFPLKVLVYNPNTQKTNSANIANRKQLYVFLENTSENEVLNFQYPVSIKYAGNNEVVVNSNVEFMNALQTCN